MHARARLWRFFYVCLLLSFISLTRNEFAKVPECCGVCVRVCVRARARPRAFAMSLLSGCGRQRRCHL